jgi:plastocyanin
MIGRVRPSAAARAATRRGRGIGALLACAALLPAGVALAARAGSARTSAVLLKNIAFSPQTVRIHHGDSVRWIWRDGSIPHNVVASSFHSSTKTSGSFTVRFTRRGSFAYSCTLHQNMRGRVVVS